MSDKSPIRIGFIGLSPNAWWAASAHWPYLKQTDKYQIVALCNSSVDAAQKARAHFELPNSVKCYGSAADIAADNNVDLVVCSVRVDMHYAAIKPALENKKSVYCEWPLAANLTEVKELVSLGGAGKHMVGLQARQGPLVLKVKEIVESQRFGRVLSSSVLSSAGNAGASESHTLRYFANKKVGGNIMSIPFGHMIDFICFTLGELKTLSSRVSTQRPTMDLVKDGKVIETVPRDTPDQIMLHGELQSGAVISVHQRSGTPFKGEPGLIWRIYCEKGEIQVTAAGSFLQIGYPDMVIKVHDHEKDEVEEVSFEGSGIDVGSDLQLYAQNVARLYEAYAAGTYFSGFDLALQRHTMLASIYKSSEDQTPTRYL